MAKSHLPEITIHIKRDELIGVTALMRAILTNEAAVILEATEKSTQVIWLVNVSIARSWVKKSDLQSDKTTVKLDAAQGLAFIQYWNMQDFDGYPFEQNALRKILATLDRELLGLRFKSLKSI